MCLHPARAIVGHLATDPDVLSSNCDASGTILFVPLLISGNVCHCGSPLWEQGPHPYITMFINSMAESIESNDRVVGLHQRPQALLRQLEKKMVEIIQMLKIVNV